MNRDLSKYRLQVSREKLEAARILFTNEKFKDSVSRSYYAMFSATRALLATKGLDSSEHSGIISLFNQNFIKTEILDKDLGRLLVEAKDLREDSDYEDFIIVSRDEAEEQLKEAEKFIHNIEAYLKRTWET